MQKLRYGMIGLGSNFSRLHLKCSALDNLAVLTASCFSRDREKGIQVGKEQGVSEDRCYPDYKTMAEMEARREDKIDFVIIATPNVEHYEMAKTFLEHGFHVMLDKPMTHTSEQAIELARLAEEKKLLLNLTYTFTGFPAVRQAREMVRNGDIGKINAVTAEFSQCWAAEEFYRDGKVARWRVDPKIAGISCCTADIGIHIECLVRYLTGLEIDRVSACLDSFNYNTELEVNSMIMVKYVGGAVGQYFASEVCAGYLSEVKVRLFGEKGSIEWKTEQPDQVIFARFNEPKQILSITRPYMYPEANKLCRTGTGWSEGVYGAVSNLYREFCNNLIRIRNNEPIVINYPGAWDGIASMRYIEAAVKSAANDSMWVTVEK